MASFEYEQILRIQAWDLELRQVRHRHATHPAREPLVQAVSVTQQIEEQLAEIGAQKHSVQRDLNRLADSVAKVEAKRAEVDQKLYGGSVTANKELLSLQQEASNLVTRQTSIEDEELEIMEQIEVLDTKVTELEARKQQALSTQKDAEEVLGAALALLDAELAEIESQREGTASLANPELLKLYEDMAPQFDGTPVAKLTNGRCDGCHIQLSAIAVDQINKAPEESVVSCEECGRVLVR